ncbi:MAG: hypothetical protein ACR2OV_15915 [Hyphomicrobiaceae bacterium]
MAIQEPFVDPNTGEAIKSLAAGGRIVDVLHATATIDFGSIAANVAADSDVTITGARANDICIVSPPAGPDAEITFTAFVESANTVTVRAANNSAGAVNPASGTYRIMVYKFAEGV